MAIFLNPEFFFSRGGPQMKTNVQMAARKDVAEDQNEKEESKEFEQEYGHGWSTCKQRAGGPGRSCVLRNKRQRRLIGSRDLTERSPPRSRPSRKKVKRRRRLPPNETWDSPREAKETRVEAGTAISAFVESAIARIANTVF